MSYQELVDEGANALITGEDADWQLARVTYEACGPSLGARRSNPGKVTLSQWSADIRKASGRKFGLTTASEYRLVWERYGSLTFSAAEEVSFTEALAEVRAKEPESRTQSNLNVGLRNATPEQKQELFRRIVREEPAVVQQAWKDTETNVALSKARWEAREELLEPQREAIRETREVFEPKDSTLDRRIFLADVATKVEQWTRELNGIREFLQFSDDVDRIRRWATRQALDRLVDAATTCRDALPSSYEEQAEAPVVTNRERRKLA